MRYLLADSDYAIDTRSFEFVKKSALKIGSCGVPSYLWSRVYGTDRYTVQDGRSKQQVRAFSLNCLDVYISFSDGVLDDVIELRFYDSSVDRWSAIDIDVKASSWSGRADVTCWVNSNKSTLSVSKSRDFIDVPKELAMKSIGGYFGAEFPFGIWHNKFKLMYRGVQLRGSSYAMLLGPWAVLLTDGLVFDSFVSLGGMKSETLYIDSMIHIASTRMAKAIMLIK